MDGPWRVVAQTYVRLTLRQWGAGNVLPMYTKNPKRGENQVPRKLTSSIGFFNPCNRDFQWTPMPRISCQNDKNSGKKKLKQKLKKKKIQKFNFFFQGFSSFRQLTLDIWVFNRFMGSPDCKDLKNPMEEVNIQGTWKNPLFGVLEAWMTFKKPEMDKTLKNGLSMIETDPLNHKWLDFVI